MRNRAEFLARILQVPLYRIEDLQEAMRESVGIEEDILGRVGEDLENQLARVLEGREQSAEEVRRLLADKVREHEEQLYKIVGITRERFDFEKIAKAARKFTSESRGFFLKREFAEKILKRRPPETMLKYFGYDGTEELLSKQNVWDAFSALRFTESDEWMHETFRVAYGEFTSKDFERRPIELRVLGEQWKEIAAKYVAKKRHNVSNLKEFGIIFVNPIEETGEGKFLRDFALLLHYFHELAFYGKLFDRASRKPEFPSVFASLLRGDVPEKTSVEPGEWLIVQRYLWKENPDDDRLFLPRVNPEALHWRKAQKDLVALGKAHKTLGIEFWDELWKTASFFENQQGEEELVSFHVEDVAMEVAAASDGRKDTFFYHQREDLWNELFASFVGGYERLEQKLMENMDKGVIRFTPPSSE